MLDVSNRVKDILSYVSSDGKRIRPVVALALADSLKLSISIKSAVAIELLHISSLIHDDLPAIDNDDLRRGRLSCHKKFTESEAILVGNYLFALAFKIADTNFIPYLADIFSKLNYGQILDLDSSYREANLEQVHILKTGELFSACFILAGLSLDDDKIKELKDLGIKFGVLFQYYNDFIDIHSDKSATGREVSSDIKNNRKGIFNNNYEESKEMLLKKVFEFKEEIKKIEMSSNLSMSPINDILDLLQGKI